MMAGKTAAGAVKTWTKTRFLSVAVLLTLGFGAQNAVAKTETVGHHHHAAQLASRNRHLASTATHHYAAGATHHYASTSRHHYAYANHHGSTHYAHYAPYRVAHYSAYRHHLRYASAHYSYSRLQCVPYAREVSHIQLSGDAFLWWAEASGRYARGNAPVEGAVLNFRSIRRMPLGHVAVVTSVIDSRTILVTQANWIRGSITNDVTMQDVSPNNDWSQVQVELGDSSRWGAAYPTYGFIYNQPATSTVIASSGQGDEVAEAPRPAAVATDAPNRNLQ